jgi:PAP2 superfamily
MRHLSIDARRHRRGADRCRHVFLSLTGAVFLGLTTTPIGAAHAQTLLGENARDLARVTATVLAQVNALRATITTDGVRRLRPDIAIHPDNPEDQITLWHTLALNVSAVDHTSQLNAAGEQINFEQYGPHRTSYALAIVHIAMFEVANAYAPMGSRYKSWIVQSRGNAPAAPPSGASEAAAIIGAAYATLIDLYQNLQPELRQQRDIALSQLAASASARTQGESYGEALANQVIALRANDGSQLPEPRWGLDFVALHPAAFDGTYPKGQWQVDPVSNILTALGGNWPRVTPFVLSSGSQFRAVLPNPPVPDLTDAAYRTAFDQVFALGADALRNQQRVDTPNEDHYFRAKFWSYDASAGLCAPARLYNQISDQVLQNYHRTIAPDWMTPGHAAAAVEIARYYALINTAMADAGIAAWDGKYHFQYWRPVTGIRYEQDKANSGGTATNRTFHELWYPLGAQTTNSVAGYNITPPFPSYPSGHAVFGGALFQVLRMLVPYDHGFSFQSDEFNGRNSLGPNIDAYNFERCKDGDNSPIYCKPITFASFTDAENDNAESRVWMGVHWQFDADAGIALGEKIGSWIYANAFRPVH